jgi:hypothetical protein
MAFNWFLLFLIDVLLMTKNWRWTTRSERFTLIEYIPINSTLPW